MSENEDTPEMKKLMDTGLTRVAAEQTVERAKHFQEVSALIAKLRAMHAATPKGKWVPFCGEGNYRGTLRKEHSVCIDPPGDRTQHECVTYTVADDEPKAKALALYVSESHNALPEILDLLEELLNA